MIGNGRPIEPYYDLIAQGRLPGKRPFRSIGERSNIGVTVQGEDMSEILSLTEIPSPPAAGEQMTLVSDDANDTALGSGIRKVRIEYIQGTTGIELTTDIIPNGLTEVDTTPLDIAYINDMYAVENEVVDGIRSVAAGNIIIYRKGTASRIYNMIKIGGNKSLVSNRMVPMDKTMFVTGWTCSEANSKITSYRLRATCDPQGNNLTEGFLFQEAYKMKENAPYQKFDPPRKICGGAIIKVSAFVDIAGGEGSANFNGYLI